IIGHSIGGSGGEIGKRKGLKIPRGQPLAGSIPAPSIRSATLTRCGVSHGYHSRETPMRFVLFAVLTVAVALPLSAQRPGDTLRAFTSDAEFVTFYRGLREEQERARRAAYSAYRRRAEAEEQCRRQAVSLTITQQPDTASKHAVITGRAMPGAFVSISALNLKSNAGKDGRFRLVIPAESLAAPRQFTLWAQLIGYDRASRTLTVERGDSVDMTLRLCQSVLRLESVVSLSAATVVVDGVQAEQASRSR